MEKLELVLLSILVFINARVIYLVLARNLSAFSPISIFSLTVITQMFPAIYVIYHNSFYDKSIIPMLLFVMVTCQLGFNIGFRKGSTSKVPKRLKEFEYRNLHKLIIVLTVCGLLPLPFYSNLDTVYGGINVVLGLLRSIGTFGLIVALIYIDKFPRKYLKLMLLCVFLSAFQLFYFSYFVKGSREGFFALGVIGMFFLPKFFLKSKKKVISIAFFLAFLLGSFVSGSITEIRRINNYKEDGAGSIGDIDFVDNFENSLTSRDVSNGMDLGNGGILIQYVMNNSTYDYGVEVWNGFVYNFFPARVFGDSFKDSIYLDMFDDADTDFLEKKLTNGISTKTGYYYAFKSFSIFGGFLFLLIGFLIGKFNSWSSYSAFYLFVYVSTLAIIPNMLTHSTQYMFGRFELIFFLLHPVFYYFTYKKNVE